MDITQFSKFLLPHISYSIRTATAYLTSRIKLKSKHLMQNCLLFIIWSIFKKLPSFLIYFLCFHPHLCLLCPLFTTLKLLKIRTRSSIRNRLIVLTTKVDCFANAWRMEYFGVIFLFNRFPSLDSIFKTQFL